MDPKAELLVVNKKEVIVVIVLLILVALFSFTLGLRLGKGLAAKAGPQAEHPPLSEKSTSSHPVGDEHSKEHSEAASKDPHQNEQPVKADAVDELEGEKHESASEAKNTNKAPSTNKAEDLADAELSQELEKSNVATDKVVALSIPKEKSIDRNSGARYTLQVGSHRTVAEAAEQVADLKRHDLDAFYLEAKVPGKGTWYRVGIGLFENKDVAERTAVKWKTAKALPPYIVQKVSE
ncbi:MAG: SPOR domain-containing protein [Bdellovibrionota bacterium]